MAWLMLASSLATLATHRLIALFLLICTIITAAYTHIIDWQAILLLACITLIAIIRLRFQHYLPIKIISEITLLICAIGLFIHLFPGFNNLKYLDKVTVGTHSAPFTMYFNFDKALVPFILLACLPTLFICRPAKHATKVQWALLVSFVPLLLLIATAAGGLAFEWHFPSWLPAFMLCNLFFCFISRRSAISWLFTATPNPLVKITLPRISYYFTVIWCSAFCWWAVVNSLCYVSWFDLWLSLDVEW